MAIATGRSPHEVLGIAPGASEEAIKQAYRSQAQRHHPDKHKDDPTALARFQDIQAAYQALMKPAPVVAGRPPAWDNAFEDLFSQFFQQAYGPRAVQRVEIALTLEQLFAPRTMDLTLPDGSVAQVHLPAGLDTGDRVPLSRQGQRLDGWEAQIRSLPHALYRREGADLHRDLTLSYAQLVLGGPLELDVFGQRIEGQLPPGLPPGHRLRLPERGLPMPHGGRGDLYLGIRLELPAKLTKLQRKALESFDAKLHPKPKTK